MTQRSGIICRTPAFPLLTADSWMVVAHRLMTDRRYRHLPATLFAFLAVVCAMVAAQAGPMPARATATDAVSNRSPEPALPSAVRMLRDRVYGNDPQERFDVYLPPQARRAPVIVMVHGGAWMVGHKAMPPVVENKVAHWSARGVVVVSIDYRLVPQATPVEQAEDVARALATVQSMATSWGADPNRVVLMGHSAGAHLVALVGASPARAAHAGARPWLGTVVLDSAALDLGRLMRSRHARFYDRAFGTDPAAWPAASPTDALAQGAPPMLLICSTLRSDDACAQSERFAEAAKAVGLRAEVSPQALSHADVNGTHGLAGRETDAVDTFLGSIGFFDRP